MATIDSLNRAKRKLERFQHEQDQVITRLGNEVTRLWDATGQPVTLEALRTVDPVRYARIVEVQQTEPLQSP